MVKSHLLKKKRSEEELVPKKMKRRVLGAELRNTGLTNLVNSSSRRRRRRKHLV
jgi:hypothetical protein